MLCAVVLAAGEGRRFGAVKQLAPFNGEPMLRLVLQRAIELCGPATYVVLGAHAADIAPLLGRSAATVVINSNWREGLASSIRAGIERLPGSCNGVLLLLADQPAVTVADMQRLADAWRRAPQFVVASQYSGTVGVPAIFPRSEFGALLQLRGDHGARQLLRRNPERLIAVPVGGAALDVDTPSDLPQA